MSMSFLRLRHPPLEPDSVEETTSEADPTSPISSHYRTPSMSLQMPRMNRSKSEDPPGTSFIRMNRNRITTYDTAVEDEDDDGSSAFGASNTTLELPPLGSTATAESSSPPTTTSYIRRDDPPELSQTNTSNPVVTSSILSTSTSSSLLPQYKSRGVPTEIVPKPQLDVPLPKIFDKDRNLISNAPLHGPTRSPETTLVSSSTISSAVKSENNHLLSHRSDDIHKILQPDSKLFIPLVEPEPDPDPVKTSLSMHRSVQFANVQIHEHITLDTSGDSENSQNYYIDSQPFSPDGHSILKPPRRQNDPPPSVLSIVSTVDEYEARREPYRRRLKEQEKESGTSKTVGSRTDQLRRILSIGTNSSSSTLQIHDSNSSSIQINASDYVSVQELVPKEQSRIGTSRTVEEQPPLSENANDIFEAYQQSFIEVDQGEQQVTTNARQQQRQRPQSLIHTRRSVSVPSLSRSAAQQPPPQRHEPHEGRGLFRRFFPKKDLHLKIEI